VVRGGGRGESQAGSGGGRLEVRKEGGEGGREGEKGGYNLTTFSLLEGGEGGREGRRAAHSYSQVPSSPLSYSNNNISRATTPGLDEGEGGGGGGRAGGRDNGQLPLILDYYPCITKEDEGRERRRWMQRQKRKGGAWFAVCVCVCVCVCLPSSVALSSALPSFLSLFHFLLCPLSAKKNDD